MNKKCKQCGEIHPIGRDVCNCGSMTFIPLVEEKAAPKKAEAPKKEEAKAEAAPAPAPKKEKEAAKKEDKAAE